MKKLIAILLAGTLIFGMSVQAFAAGSSTGSTTDTGVEATADSGTVETTTIDYTSGGTSSTDETVPAPPTIDGYTIVWTGDVTVSDTDDGTTTITFYVTEVTSDSSVIVYVYENGSWVQKEVTVEDGKVIVAGLAEGTYPVAIYVADESDESTSSSTTTTSSSSTSSSSTSSPQTGEFPVSGTLAVVIAAALAGMLLTQRRRSVEG